MVGQRAVQGPGRRLDAELGQQPLLDAFISVPTARPFLNHCLKLRDWSSSACSQLFMKLAG